MRRLLVLWGILGLLVPNVGRAQTLMDDSQGRSALLIPATYVGVNTAEETLKAGVFYDPYRVHTRVDTVKRGTSVLVDSLVKTKLPGYLDNRPKVFRIITISQNTTACPRTKTIEVHWRIYQRVTNQPGFHYNLRTKKVRYVIQERDKYQSFMIGAQAQTKNVGGVSSLFDGGNLSFANRANLFVGKHSVIFPEFVKDSTGCDLQFNKPAPGRPFIRDWVLLRAGYDAAEYYIFDNSKAWRDQLPKHKFRAGSLGLYYNVNIDGKYLAGVAGGYQRTNNYSSLDEITVTQRYSTSNAVKDSTRTVDKKITAATGDYRAYNSGFFYADAARFFYKAGSKSFYVLNLYYRNDKYFNSKHIQRAGVGLYLLNPQTGAINLGLFMEQTDWTNALDKDTTFGERIKVGATVKFPIGTAFIEPKAAKADATEKKK